MELSFPFPLTASPPAEIWLAATLPTPKAYEPLPTKAKQDQIFGWLGMYAVSRSKPKPEFKIAKHILLPRRIQKASNAVIISHRNLEFC